MLERMIADRKNLTAAVMDNKLLGASAYKFQEHSNQEFSCPYNSPYNKREQFPLQMPTECCYNVGPHLFGQNYPGNFFSPTSGYSDLIRHGEFGQFSRNFNHTGTLSLPGNNIVEPNNSISSMGFGNPLLNHELVSQCRLQALQSKQSNFQLCPPARFGPSKPLLDGFSVVPKNVHNPVPGQRSSKSSQLLSVGHKNTRQERFCNFQAPEPADLIRTLHNILSLYVKSRLADVNMSRQEFLSSLHLVACKGVACKCENHLVLISQFDKCQNAQCDICGPVRQLFYVERIMNGPGYRKDPVSGNVHSTRYVIQDSQPFAKRMKMEDDIQHDDWSLGAVVRQHLKKFVGGLADREEDKTKMNKISSAEGHINSVALNNEIPNFVVDLGDNLLSGDFAFDDKGMDIGDGISHIDEIFRVDEQGEMGSIDIAELKSDGPCLSFDGVSVLSEELPLDEIENTEWASEIERDKGEAECGLAKSHCLAKSDCLSEGTLVDLKVSGVSLIDFFSPEQIKEHLHSLNQFTDLSAWKGITEEKRGHTVDENTCQLCDVGVRMFTPPPMYCTCCGAQIKNGSCYYRPSDDESNLIYCFCTLCFKLSRGGNISFKGLSFSKAKLEKCKNADELPEGWVQCDKCEAWQHQICGLYNSKQDLEGKSNYICPFCRLFELEVKGHTYTPPTFGAKDLPRTKLSDHIEQRLFRCLEIERKQRAEILGKPPGEVCGVEDLVVRVVLAVNKELKVKQQFLDILHGETYPTEFPYRSKVLMLFQKVEGVDVCLFAMYLQEFGSECGHPNKRSVYISYLDSAKYFRPEIKTVGGLALRTFVYHEILIGYIDYCKQRGFATCYIWACPPLRGEDYILYCHPENQKTPNPHKLLQWYKKLLKKAKEENVVVEYTNFYNHFFLPSEESNSKITAARLPYFDGDYWSCAIEDMIQIIEKESEENSGKNLKIHTTKRALRAMGHSDLSVKNKKDILVMQKLGQTILPLKEDFIVVHLQFTCTNCHEPILSGSRWSCNHCSKYHICHRCFVLERNSSEPETHTSVHGEKHQLFQILVNDVAGDTEDKDVLLDNDLFKDRLSFLKFCQKNNHQFDTIRHAKHSSMMILHHLKTATAITSMQPT